jgi:glycosyltransferase involved in cell wall biosynthesis
MQELLDSLSEAELLAVSVIDFCLKAYNSYDGAGEFSGPGRYEALAFGVSLAAAQSNGLPEVWAALARRMRWPVPPRALNEELVELFQNPKGGEAVRVLRHQARSVIEIAYALNKETKDAKRTSRLADGQ